MKQGDKKKKPNKRAIWGGQRANGKKKSVRKEK